MIQSVDAELVSRIEAQSRMVVSPGTKGRYEIFSFHCIWQISAVA